jgi:hypothetical protein
MFEYSLAVPKAWAYSKEFGPVPSGPFATQGIGFFAGSAQPGFPLIAVTVTPIPFEIPIDTWVRANFVAEGWQIRSAKWFPGALGLFFDIVGTRVFQDVLEVRRTSVRVDGSHIFALNCFCSLERWEAAKELFWAAHCTFKLEKGTGLTRMEPWLAAAADEEPAFSLAYPRSWSVEPVASPPEGVSGLDVRLLDVKGEVLLAYLQVKAERRASGTPPPKLDARLAEAQGKLAGSGVTSTSPPRPLTEDEDPRSIAVKGWLGGFIGAGRLGDAEIVIRLGFLERAGVDVTFLVLSPTPSDDALIALRAERIFQIARATFALE